jgi:hypothetical protein
MAVGADCGASTVLEESRVARTVGSLVPGACRVENSKFEIRNPCRPSEFRIRTRHIAGRSRKLVRYSGW